MHSSSRPSVPARPCRFETNRQAEPKTHGPGARREDKNMNTSLNTATSSTRRVTRGPPESSRFRSGAQAGRNITVKPTVARQQKNTTQSSAANPKPKSRQAVSNLPPVVTDPNCNEPSLPCLCCDGRSPQDSNSLFNHNHNNNNTITMRQQLQLQQPSIPRKEEEDWQRKPVVENKAETNPDRSIEVTKEAVKGPKGPVAQVDKKKEEISVAEDKERVGEEDSDVEVPVAPGVDPNGNNQVSVEDEDDGDDDDDDDTLVPSCCDCPASMLEFSLSSSTSSSSTSISSCSDLELDCPDTYSLSSQDQDAPERYPSARSSTAQPHILPLDPNVPSGHPMSPCSPDEGYPSAPCSPSSDFSDCKEETEQFGTKPGLLNFLDSMDELGKMDRFYHVVQVVCWELDDEMGLRDRLDHLYRLEKVNRQVKLFHLAKLQEAGLDLEDEDISDVLDEMGNIDIPWKLYKGESSCESQEFSDAGVDVSGPSDLDEPAVPDSLSSSPLEPPPRPPKPPVRHVSAQPETHTYINIEQSSPVVSSSASPTSSAVGSPSPSSHLIKKPIPDPPPLPPPPSQAIPYFTLYSASSCAPSPTPPIPPPRTRHLARREALRCAQLQAEQSPMSLPPPTSKPPPLPPPPALPSPPKIPPPPPSLPPPPSFHALDVEIQKLLALAGLTQAELLKLSPELGVCVSGVLDSSQGEEEEKSIVAPGPQPARLSRSGENTKIGGDRVSKYEPKGMKGAWIDGWGEAEKFGEHRGTDMSPGNDTYGDRTREAKRDALRTTSFTEMARRRKQNGGSTNSSCSCGYGVNTSLSTDAYYSTEISNANSTNATFDNFDYSSELPDTPPPPPPRPLPPCPPVTSKPPELPPVMPCTVPANASRPDRFDWLIAFTPDTEASPWELRKCTSGVVLPKVTLGSKVTTFKELRNRSKQSSLPAPAEPEPDPTVTTPDPDFLYNLKWRRGKNGGDGSQWEYTSQAEASFLMPPPTPASLSLFREMRHLTLEGDGQAEPHPSQRIGCSASEGNLWNMGAERAGDGKQREEEEEVQVRGRADGGRTLESRTTAVRSLSFAGSVQKAGAWMGDDDDASSALRGSSLSSQCLQEKRALVSAVSLAVEAILAQFSSSRTLVQKALSGDSSINPTLGRLVLQCLCPSLRRLLSDGLKPHQSDLIAGRRPNSPWGLVQASTKPGPRTQGLHSLQARVADLPQLRQSGHRFNAFLLGLLNTKLLDYWISHLQTCSDVLLTYYRPNSFMRLSLTSCQPLFEELLLLLQPLSLLTFNLDLLFQHHHFDPASPADPPTNHSPDLTSPPNQELGFGVSPWGPVQGHRLESVSEYDVGRPESCPSNQNTALSSLAKPLAGGVVQSSCRGPVPVSAFASKGETSPQLQWVREKDIAPPPEESEYSSLSQQAGQVLHQGWGAVVRWGERLGHNLNSLGSSSEDTTTGISPDSHRGPDILRSQPQEEASSWANSVAVPWGLERLFGASKNSCNPPANTPQARRPSQWLAPSVSVLARMVSGSQPSLPDRIHVEAKQAKPAEKKREETQDKPKPTRAVRTLCDHSGSGTELTFQKGEELIVLGSVDQDWIRCRQGDKEGLVPIGYTSLIM
ncbi:RUN and SH3 domain containing 1 isoform X2 [Alosa pseudoharengus]|uniref:RUN and SH3 domain containing 1 isoform X2 n=1 Tax=Alosa pseudoharengus TaxID=34774 RepID=UPI003F8AA8E7